MTYSTLFPQINKRTKTPNAKPFLPHLSCPAKNLAGNDLFAPTHLLAYVYLLQALQRYILTIAHTSPQSSPPLNSNPTRWLRWGFDRLLSVPVAPSESLCQALAMDSPRLLGAILQSSFALELALHGPCWLTPQTAVCQPIFFNRRLVPLPTSSIIPVGFPLALAPFPRLRARFVRMFGRLDMSSHSSSAWSDSDRATGGHLSKSYPGESISRHRKHSQLEEKYIQRLRQLWVDKAPFGTANLPTEASHDEGGWVVCQLIDELGDSDKGGEEMVWPVGQCLLDLEGWLASSEESSLSDTSAELDNLAQAPEHNRSTPSVRLRLPLSRHELAAGLLCSSTGPIEELAESAGGYIDWVAQERELQRKAIAAGRDKSKDKEKEDIPVGRAGSQCQAKLSETPKSASTDERAIAGPHSPPSDTPSTRPLKRRREDLGNDISSTTPIKLTPTTCSGHSTKLSNNPTSASNPSTSLISQPLTVADVGFSFDPSVLEDGEFGFLKVSPNIDTPLISRAFVASTHAEIPGGTMIDQPIPAASNPMPSLPSECVIAGILPTQQGSGSGSSASTISFHTNLFEQPTPAASASISGLTPGRVHGLTPDPAASLFALPAAPHVSTVAISLRKSLQNSQTSLLTSPAVIPRRPLVDPPGYESIYFGPSDSFTNHHYQRRGGKFALPPSPCSFGETASDDGSMGEVEEERRRRLMQLSRRLAQETDPRTKLVRTGGNRRNPLASSYRPVLPDTTTMTMTSRGCARLNLSLAAAPPASAGDIPPTPRSWIPLGSSNESMSGATFSDDEDDEDEDEQRTVLGDEVDRRRQSVESSSSDGDDHPKPMTEDAEVIVANILKLEACLKNVLEHNKAMYFSNPERLVNSPTSGCKKDVITRSALAPARVPLQTRERLRNLVGELGGQAVYDPELECLLESLLPQRPTVAKTARSEFSLADGEVPRLAGIDYYRPRVDNLRHVQEDRAASGADDGRPFLTGRALRPTSMVVRCNSGQQKLAFPACALRHWTKFGLEPISGRRDVCLSVVLPRDNPAAVDIQAHVCSIRRWLEGFAQAYAVSLFPNLLSSYETSLPQIPQLTIALDRLLNLVS